MFKLLFLYYKTYKEWLIMNLAEMRAWQLAHPFELLTYRKKRASIDGVNFYGTINELDSFYKASKEKETLQEHFAKVVYDSLSDEKFLASSLHIKSTLDVSLQSKLKKGNLEYKLTDAEWEELFSLVDLKGVLNYIGKIYPTLTFDPDGNLVGCNGACLDELDGFTSQLNCLTLDDLKESLSECVELKRKQQELDFKKLEEKVWNKHFKNWFKDAVPLTSMLCLPFIYRLNDEVSKTKDVDDFL